MEVRALQVKDIFTVAKILGKVSKSGRLALASTLAGSASPTDVGISLITGLFTEAEVEVKTWLADMIGVKPSEFETMPPSALIDVIEGIAAQEEWKTFLSRVSSLMGKINLTGNGKTSTPSSTDTGGQTKPSSESPSPDISN